MAGIDRRERRHPAGPEPWWGESWYLDFVARDGSIGGYCRLGLYPGQGAAWFWLYVVGQDRPTVRIRDHGLPCPAGEVLELATPDWSSHLEATPGGFRVAAEGTALALDDPLEAYRGERGRPVDLSADLEWHGRGAVFEYEVTTRYEQTCRVGGRLRVGGEEWEIDATGQRDHSWGVRDWLRWHLWTSGTLEDGSAYHLVQLPELSFTVGYLLSPDDELAPLTAAQVRHRLDGELLPVGADMVLETAGGRLALTAEAARHAPVLLETPDGRGSRFPRSTVALRADDGRRGWGWIEYNLPGGEPGGF